MTTTKNKRRATVKKYQNSEKGRATRKKQRLSKKGQASRQKYFLSEKGRKMSREKSRRWRKRNPQLARDAVSKWAKTNKVSVLLRKRIGNLLRGQKSASTLQLLGCSVNQFREWMEAQFEPGMTWANQGEWHIDHIRPCSSFDLSDPAQQRECFNFTNAQPLWAKDNLSKGAKWQ